jgi:hypothetical protein
LSQSGLTFFDKPTSDYLRKTGGLPATPDEEEMGPPPGMIPDPAARYEQAGAGAPRTSQPPDESHDLETPPEPQSTVPDARPAASNEQGRERLRV